MTKNFKINFQKDILVKGNENSNSNIFYSPFFHFHNTTNLLQKTFENDVANEEIVHNEQFVHLPHFLQL